MNEGNTPTADAPIEPTPFVVHDALGNWMVQDVQMGRMICMSTRKRDADFIAEALNQFAFTNRARAAR